MTENRKTKHVVVIGAGIAGLSAASYLLRNAYQVTIVEQHSLPGGLCTSWKRNGYTIDYCVHWLMGTNENSEFNRVWRELGAFTNADGSTVPIVDFDDFTTIGLSTGETVCLYGDRGRLREELLRIAPEDEKEIERFCKALEKLENLSMSGITEEQTVLKGIGKIMGNLGSMLAMMQHLVPMEEYVKQFKSPRLRELFLTEIPADWSLIALTLGLSQQPKKWAGYTVGGSLNLARNMERVIRELGGTFMYGCEATQIIVEQGRATGVRIADGTTISADYVISAADGYATLHSLLGGAFLPKQVKAAYDSYPLFPSSVMVALGVDRDCSTLPHTSSPYFSEPLSLPDGTDHHRFNVNVYHFDPTLAPAGKTLITVLINTWEGPKWESLYREDLKRYAKEKDRIAQEVIARLDSLFGDIANHIEMIDVSTPRSVMRYTGNWQGSYEGFAPTRKTLSKKLPKKLEGLRQFAMIGQWTTPGGGLPTAAKDGRDIAISLCKEDGKRFSSSRPLKHR